jgi:hypothetical protein
MFVCTRVSHCITELSFNEPRSVFVTRREGMVYNFDTGREKESKSSKYSRGTFIE